MLKYAVRSRKRKNDRGMLGRAGGVRGGCRPFGLLGSGGLAVGAPRGKGSRRRGGVRAPFSRADRGGCVAGRRSSSLKYGRKAAKRRFFFF